jgi:TonB family protein
MENTVTTAVEKETANAQQPEAPKQEEQQPKKQEETAAAPEPVEPKLKTGDLVPLIEGEVEFPKIIKRVEPKKTAAARRMRIRGTIVAQMLIDENGNIKDVRILRNIPGRHGLDKQVIKALKQWRFTPAIKDGVRVSVYYTQTFKF